MPRDYVKSRSSRRQERSGPSGVVWLLMGVLIGLIIAGVFYVKNQHRTKPSLTPEVQQKTSLNPAAQEPQMPQASNKTPEKPASTQNLQTQFDFYNVLPNQKVTGPSGDEDTSQVQQHPTSSNTPTPNATPAQTPEQQQTPVQLPPPVPTKTKPAAKLPSVVQAAPAYTKPKPQTPAPAKSSNYIVQVATLKESGDADQLKAQLTLLGFDVKVTDTRKSLHRVWLGPFHSTSEAESIQKQLQENMISSKVLKSDS